MDGESGERQRNGVSGAPFACLLRLDRLPERRDHLLPTGAAGRQSLFPLKYPTLSNNAEERHYRRALIIRRGANALYRAVNGRATILTTLLRLRLPLTPPLRPDREPVARGDEDFEGGHVALPSSR